MSAHVLLNLLNELGKSDKLQGLPSILSLFRNEYGNILGAISQHYKTWCNKTVLQNLVQYHSIAN